MYPSTTVLPIKSPVRYFEQLPNWVVDQRLSQFTSTDAAVYWALLLCAGGGGYAYASYRKLARMAGCHRESIRRAVEHLTELGIIEVERRAAGGRRESHQYHIVHGSGRGFSKLYTDIGRAYLPRLSGPAILVFWVLLRCSGGDGYAYPGVRKIARLSGCAAGTVRKAFAELAAEGLIVVEPPGDDRRTNLYRIVQQPTADRPAPSKGTTADDAHALPKQTAPHAPAPNAQERPRYNKAITKAWPRRPRHWHADGRASDTVDGRASDTDSDLKKTEEQTIPPNPPCNGQAADGQTADEGWCGVVNELKTYGKGVRRAEAAVAAARDAGCTPRQIRDRIECARRHVLDGEPAWNEGGLYLAVRYANPDTRNPWWPQARPEFVRAYQRRWEEYRRLRDEEFRREHDEQRRTVEAERQARQQREQRLGAALNGLSDADLEALCAAAFPDAKVRKFLGEDCSTRSIRTAAAGSQAWFVRGQVLNELEKRGVTRPAVDARDGQSTNETCVRKSGGEPPPASDVDVIRGGVPHSGGPSTAGGSVAGMGHDRVRHRTIDGTDGASLGGNTEPGTGVHISGPLGMLVSRMGLNRPANHGISPKALGSRAKARKPAGTTQGPP